MWPVCSGIEFTLRSLTLASCGIDACERFAYPSRVPAPTPRNAVILTLLAAVAAYQWHQNRVIAQPVGVLAPDAPVQIEIADAAPIGREPFELTPRASFEATVRVLGRERYRIDTLAPVVPWDLAVGWGPMSDTKVLEQIDVSQSGRFYFWETSTWPIDRDAIAQHSANWHIIPASRAVELRLADVRAGHVVSLVGRLVDIKGSNGEARTSMTRDDVGAGACEIILVDELRVENTRD
jgi:hypothetical protein